MRMKVQQQLHRVDEDGFLLSREAAREAYLSMVEPVAGTIRLNPKPNKNTLRARRTKSSTLGEADIFDVWQVFMNNIDKRLFSRAERRLGGSSSRKQQLTNAFGSFELGSDEEKPNPHIHFYVDNEKGLPKESFLDVLNHSWSHTQIVSPFANREAIYLSRKESSPDIIWSNYQSKGHFPLQLTWSSGKKLNF